MKVFLLGIETIGLLVCIFGQTLLFSDVVAANQADIHGQIEHLLRLSPTEEVEHEAESYFRAISTQSLVAAKEILVATKPCAEKKFVMVALIKRWSRYDGPAAYSFAQSQSVLGRTHAESLALAGWASYEPAKAWKELMIVSHWAADSRYSIIPVLEQVANADLDLALEFYQDLVPDRACLQCSAAYLLISAARNGNFEKILRFVHNMVPGPSRDALRNEYWFYLGQYLPELGMVQLKEMPDTADFRAAEVEFCNGWALSSFDDCLAYILNRASAGRFDDLILPAVGLWARFATHDDVVKLVKSLPVDLAQRSLLGLAMKLTSVDPKVTVDWVASFPHSEVRTDSLDRAMNRWAKIDQKAAHEYIKQCADTETRGILLWAYLLSKLGNHTLNFEELAEIDDRYNLDWRARLFEKISTNLADPSVNNGGKYDLEAFKIVVAERSDFSSEKKMKILAPFVKSGA